MNYKINVQKKQKGKKAGESRKKDSPAGNRTRVFRVTGGDTYHYTTEDFLNEEAILPPFILEMQVGPQFLALSLFNLHFL